MAIGATVSVPVINNNAAILAARWKQLAADTNDFYQAVSIGLGTSGLTTLGFAANDATSMKQMSDYLGTLAGVYYGTATQGSMFSFDSALTPIRGVGGR